MTVIDIGPDAIGRPDQAISGKTEICLDNPANDTGKITKIELWFVTDAGGVKAGTFCCTDPPHFFTSRDVAIIGDVASGSKQTISGLDIDVEAGDYIGIYFSSGLIERHLDGYAGVRYQSDDLFGAGEKMYSLWADDAISLYGEGETVAPPVRRIFITHI